MLQNGTYDFESTFDEEEEVEAEDTSDSVSEEPGEMSITFRFFRGRPFSLGAVKQAFINHLQENGLYKSLFFK